MQNYMIQIMRKCAFLLEYYDPYNKKFIVVDHVACFFGCQLMRVTHLPMPIATRGKSCWAKCPGIENCKGKQKRSYDTNYHCKQCSANHESNVYLCHSVKNGEVVSCHIAYHKRNHNKVFPSDKR